MKAKHLTILQWSKKIQSIADKYGVGGHITANISYGTYNEPSAPRIQYSAYSSEAKLHTLSFVDYNYVIADFEKGLKEYKDRQSKYTCPTCGGPIQSLAHKH